MSIERKLLIAAGVLLLVLMSSIATFSLGAYVGANGWTKNPESMTARDTSPPSARPPRPPGMPAGEPALTGLLVSGNEATLTLRAKEGLRQVVVDDGARLLRWDGEEMKLADLRRGMALAIFGEFDASERALRANALVLLPPPKEKDKDL